MHRLIASLIVTLSFVNLAAGAMTVSELKCEGRRQPLGIDASAPRLSWNLQSDLRGDVQTAYRILVAGSPERLAADQGDLWDSGKVTSGESLQIVYGGKPLRSRAVCYWKVQAYDKAGKASPWSDAARWEMGLLTPEDWQAQWLNDGKANPVKDEDFYKEDPAPLFRKEFTLSKPVKRARLSIAGVGYYEASLNGRRVGDQTLDPGWTKYSKRVLYSTFDVTEQLAEGQNCMGVAVGNGWYNPLPLRMWGHLNLRKHLPVGRPRWIARLDVEFADGSRQAIASDPTWKVSEGPIRFNSIYLGEIYDARKELAGWDKAGFDDAAWRQAAPATDPIGRLASQSQPPIRVTKTIKAVKVTEPAPGVFIFDLGQNFAGWARLKLKAPEGTRISLRYGELLHKDGTLNPMTSACGQIKGTKKTADGKEESVGGPGAPPVAWQGDVYIARGQGEETYTPRFTFHAFRYVEVTGYPGTPPLDAITGLRLNADVERTGHFACSNERFNRIQQICDWTFLSNLFSVQSDCPHRERFGYGGDIVATSEALMMNYDMSAFYAKAVADWSDSALEDGMLTDTAPFVGIQYCGPAWAMAHPLLQRQLYQYYGDKRLIEEHYAEADRWLDLVAKKYPDGIVQAGLSDHEALTPRPAPVMVTPLYAATARMLGELAAILGRHDDAVRHQRLAGQIQDAYLKKFLDKATGKVGPGTQASQAFALYLDLVPAEDRPAVLKALVDDIRGPRQDHLSTGIFGTKYLLDVLSREGRAELACVIADQGDFPSWGNMLEHGATTLWEHWQENDNTYSHNHPMFGSVSQWFYQWLGGIQSDPAAVGFDRVIIRPQVVGNVTWVKCGYQSARGKIVSNWRREGDRFTLAVSIPVGCTATVYVPGLPPKGTAEDAAASAESPCRLLRAEPAAAVYRVGSGEYEFTSSLK